MGGEIWPRLSLHAGSSDSASVIYDAIQKAQSAEIDLLLDTAGRLQANSQLMDELKKVKKVTGKLVKEVLTILYW